jgi:hypothetical protein
MEFLLCPGQLPFPGVEKGKSPLEGLLKLLLDLKPPRREMGVNQQCS